jgi:hypothetical protein
MSDTNKPNRPLSEISHLFLSNIRKRQTAGASMPRRTPPPPLRPSRSDELSEEEMALVGAPAAPSDGIQLPPVSAVIAGHLNGKATEQTRRLARHLAAAGQRVGLMELDGSELRLLRYQRTDNLSLDYEAEPVTCTDSRSAVDALVELSCELDCWLLRVVNPRVPEARTLLRQADRWLVLSTCDHDGLVGAYRSLKGLADLGRPRLALGLVDAREPAQARQATAKLDSVCRQFLGLQIEWDQQIHDAAEVEEHQVVRCAGPQDGTEIPGLYSALRDVLSKARAHAAAAQTASSQEFELPAVPPMPMELPPEAAPPSPQGAVCEAPVQVAREAAAGAAMPQVIELGDSQDPTACLLDSVVRLSEGQMVLCPLRLPTALPCRLVVGRDRGLLLLVVAQRGLAELGQAAAALNWLCENQRLVAMALPQLAMDANVLPRLRLLMDQSDLGQLSLQPLLQNGRISVQSFQRACLGQKQVLVLAVPAAA